MFHSCSGDGCDGGTIVAQLANAGKGRKVGRAGLCVRFELWCRRRDIKERDVETLRVNWNLEHQLAMVFNDWSV